MEKTGAHKMPYYSMADHTGGRSSSSVIANHEGGKLLATNHYQSQHPSTSTGCTVSAGAQFCNTKGRRSSPVSDNLLLALQRSGPNTKLFRALFQYIPLRDSPNENPHLELSLQAGDYILVRGQMDEDQFYMGETLAGKTGLVPSNYVEQISDASLLQNAARSLSPCGTIGQNEVYAAGCCPAPGFRLPPEGGGRVSVATQSPPMSSRSLPANLHPACSPLPACSTVLYDESTASPSFALSVPVHLAHITHDFTDSAAESGRNSRKQINPLPDSVCPYPPVDVSKVIVQEVKSDQPRVPIPRELNVEKKLSRSAVFCWLPPDDHLASVSQYHVCVDGVVKAVVPGSYKCKALIEDLNLERSVNVSVRAITENGHSPDAACTIAVGTEAPVAPQHVRVTCITPISAQVYWYPSNSNADHVVLLNAIKVGVCPPAVFQVHLQGLSPSTIYRVSVRTKHPKAVLEKRPVERCVDFKTLPKIGLPDPPQNVQVEVGPQPGTLLISWKPVTNQPRPPSRAAIHSVGTFGVLLADLADDPPIFITVRTRTREGTISADSNVVRVPRSASSTLNATGVLSSSSVLGPASLVDTSAASYSLLSTSPPKSNQRQQIDSIQQTIMPSLPMNILQQQQQSYPVGLLTTATMDGGEPMMVAAQQYMSGNLGYPTAILNPQPSTLARPLNVYTTASSSNQPMTSQHYSLVNQYAKMQPRGNALGLRNGSSPRLYERKQKNHTQYYTFHPKSLYKDFPSNEEKPSLLELENNYLLKHHQQYNRDKDIREQQQWIGSPLAEEFNMLGRSPRMDYYVQSNGQQPPPMHNAQLPRTAATVLAGSRRPVPSNPAIPPRLARVRSDEYLLGTRSEPDLRPMAAIPADEENSRWFVALYDYSHHMSPNPNARQEELTFRKHQLIKVYGDVDPDGFYYAEIGRRFGLVPSNMVIEIAKDEVVPERRRSEAYPADPVIRRMGWGSLKSRSYDHPADRSRPRHPCASSLSSRHAPFQHTNDPSNAYSSSLERREHSLPATARYSYGGYVGGPPAAGSLSARSARRYGYASTSGGYEHRTLSTSERDGYDQAAREHRDSYPSMKPSKGGLQEGDYYALPRRGGEWREESRGITSRPPDQYDYSAERKGELHQQPPQQHYSGDGQEYGSSRGRPPVEGEYAVGRYDNYNDVAAPPVANNSISGPRRMANPDSIGGKYGEEGGGHPWPQQPHGGPPQQLAGDQLQAYGAQQQQSYNSQYAGKDQQRRYPSGVTNNNENNSMAIVPSEATRRMIAKYDYDSRQLSPNVDAEQVELSFRQGEVITVFGEMDEDGFYIGELNGIRGLVPSNFLQPGLASPPSSLMTTAKPSAQLMPSATAPLFESAPRPKGVAFTDTTNNRKLVAAPIRQISQGSSKSVSSAQLPPGFAMGTGGTGMTSKANKVIGSSAGGISTTKPLIKKTSDLTSKSISATNNRKAPSAKKGEGTKMMEPLAAIQRLAEARALGMDSSCATTASTLLQSSLTFSDAVNLGQRAAVFPDESQMSREDEEDYEDDDSSTALCTAPNNESVSERQLAQREPANAVLFNYRGERVAGFEMDAGSRHMICLPQVYELFLKQLVGGLHTVYTKLKRLHIHPLICNVEQVRALRSLGAIQPGVNRCKLIEKVDFDKLYDDCTNTKSRPGRPPKRSDGSCSIEECWNTPGSGKRERLQDPASGGLFACPSNNDVSSVSSSNMRGCTTPNIVQLQQTSSCQQQLLGNLLPLTAQHLLMQHMMAAAATVVSQHQIQHHQQQDVQQQQQRLRSISSSSLSNNNNSQGGDETSSSSNESSSATNKQDNGIFHNSNSKTQEWTNNNGHPILVDGLNTADKEIKCQRAESNRFSNQFRFTILNDVEDYSNNNCPNDQSSELNSHSNGPLNLTNNNNSKFNTTPTITAVADYEDEDSINNGQNFLVTKTRDKKLARDNNSDVGDKNNSSGNQSETDNDTFEREKSLSATLNDQGESESFNRSGSQNSPSQNSPSESDQAMQFVLTKITTMIETADKAFKGHYDKLAKLTACLQGELVSLKNSELETRKLHKIEKQRSDLYFRKYSHLKREAHNLRIRARTTGSKKEG